MPIKKYFDSHRDFRACGMPSIAFLQYETNVKGRKRNEDTQEILLPFSKPLKKTARQMVGDIITKKKLIRYCCLKKKPYLCISSFLKHSTPVQ